MKRLIFGLSWQIMSFLGIIIILCSAAPHRWDYNGITGIIGSLLGLELMIPLVICVVIFIVGGVFCYRGIQEK
ncbi:MAG: hypothetical protein KHY76_00850 [Butyricicoccus pullicaecorum]|nr:hypothetical protein [Butyricicoccus pullicaecorum]